MVSLSIMELASSVGRQTTAEPARRSGRKVARDLRSCLAPSQKISEASGASEAVAPKIAPAGGVDIRPGPAGAWPSGSTSGHDRLVRTPIFVPIGATVQELGVQTGSGPRAGSGPNRRPAAVAAGAISSGSKSWFPPTF